MIPESFHTALGILLRRFSNQPITWAFTGSTGFALQGIPVVPNDIDLQTTAAYVPEIEALLADYLTMPIRFSELGGVRSHIGTAAIEGIEIEIIGDIEKKKPDGSWTAPPKLDTFIHFVPWQTWQAPVLDLAYEARAYDLMGRTEKANMLRQWLKRNPVNHRINKY